MPSIPMWKATLACQCSPQCSRFQLCADDWFWVRRPLLGVDSCAVELARIVDVASMFYWLLFFVKGGLRFKMARRRGDALEM
ncbi:hypothetical protein GOBAR_AA00257 [Gossypium barbadense]|uniref:Uncharacterized protein n=1 Tax=Gossypium barbadense TaxID=3634 RepID=A0A2P5YXQ6_GOSBA|nr:hypothetical protein GOBAR_AA00257 [Gossypium barbadense]